jgi:glycosyltransferase involved in cell wall biosynthesis
MIVAVIPTYDEIGNLPLLIGRIRALSLSIHILVVDDASPDGTGRLAEQLARTDPLLSVLHRQGRRGRGLAGRAGFLRALSLGAERIIEMDADLSHDPVHIPAMLRALKDYDLVLGSRVVPGGSDIDRGRARQILTRLANGFTRRVLALPVGDCNSGFRAFRRQALLSIDPARLRSEGPAIVHEVLYRAQRAGLRIGEVPIQFSDRREGSSTLTFRTLATSYFAVLRLRALDFLPHPTKGN